MGSWRSANYEFCCEAGRLSSLRSNLGPGLPLSGRSGLRRPRMYNPVEMTTPAALLSEEEVRRYRAAALRLEEQFREENARLEKLGWETARAAAELLRGKFQAGRVAVFGSLIHPGLFHRWSDVDVAAWGIAPDAIWRAIGAAMDLDAPIPVNLVVVESARPSIRAVIEAEGVDV